MIFNTGEGVTKICLYISIPNRITITDTVQEDPHAVLFTSVVAA
jgi:hypothetical protein